MANVGNLNVNLTGNNSQLRQTMQNTVGMINSTASKLTSSLTNMSKNISNIIKTAIIYKGLNVIQQALSGTVEAFNQLESGNLGLKSILDAQGKSFSDAQGFINDYIKDGLVPLSDAIIAYKSLTTRGYNDEQIKNTLNRLKDAAAFGRQAGLSIGEAVSGAAQGLKNENSELVDNAGVTKNVAKMWEDYAVSIGTTANKLTDQQKIQAEVNGIMNETKFQMGNAAQYSTTLGGQMAMLNAKVSELKTAFGSALAPAIAFVLPYISAFVDKITQAVNIVAQFIQLIFGTSAAQQKAATQTQAVASSASNAADAQKALGDSTKKAGDKAKKGVMGFDEVNQIQEDMADSAEKAADSAEKAADAVGGGTTPTAGTNAPMKDLIPESVVNAAQKFKETFDKIQESIKKFYDEWGGKSFFNTLFDGTKTLDFSGVKSSIDTLVADIKTKFENNKEGLKTLGNSLGTTIATAIITGIKTTISFTEGLFDGLFKTTKEIDVSGIITNTKKIIDAIRNTITENTPALEEVAKSLGNLIGTSIGTGLQMSTGFIDGVLKGIVTTMNTLFSSVKFDNISTSFKSILNSLSDIIKSVTPNLTTMMTSLGNLLGTTFVGALTLAIKTTELVAKGISDFFEKESPNITNTLNKIALNFSKTFDNIAEISRTFFATWLEAFENNKTDISKAVEGILTTLEKYYDTFGTIISDMLNIFTSGLLDKIKKSKTEIQTYADNVVKGITGSLNLLSTITSGILDSIKRYWENWGKEIFKKAVGVYTDMVGWFLQLFNNYIFPVFENALGWLKKIWNENLSGIFDEVLGFIGRLQEIGFLIYENFIKPVIDAFMTYMLPQIAIWAKALQNVFFNVFNTIASFAKNILKAINGILDFVIGVFKGDWERAWNGLKSIFVAFADNIANTFKGAVNIIITALNFFIRKLNSIQISVPAVNIPGLGTVGGGTVGFGSIQEIDYLSLGGSVVDSVPQKSGDDFASGDGTGSGFSKYLADFENSLKGVKNEPITDKITELIKNYNTAPKPFENKPLNFFDEYKKSMGEITTDTPQIESFDTFSKRLLESLTKTSTESLGKTTDTSLEDKIAGATGTAVLNAMQFAQGSGNKQQNGGNGDVVVQIDGVQLARILIPLIEKENQRVGNVAILQGV